MSSKLITPVVLAAALGLAACGGSSSSSNSHASAPKNGVRGHIYRVSLTGKAETPPGAPNGAGSAVIALHSSLTVCWRFSHLHGFTDATFAHIHRGGAGTGGPIVIPLSTTGKLHHKGCVPTTAAMIKAIEHDPAGYYVNIHSKQYPAGAVGAQL
jgi:CHRD domain-containing protein